MQTLLQQRPQLQKREGSCCMPFFLLQRVEIYIQFTTTGTGIRYKKFDIEALDLYKLKHGRFSTSISQPILNSSG